MEREDEVRLTSEAKSEVCLFGCVWEEGADDVRWSRGPSEGSMSVSSI